MGSDVMMEKVEMVGASAMSARLARRCAAVPGDGFRGRPDLRAAGAMEGYAAHHGDAGSAADIFSPLPECRRDHNRAHARMKTGHRPNIGHFDPEIQVRRCELQMVNVKPQVDGDRVSAASASSCCGRPPRKLGTHGPPSS